MQLKNGIKTLVSQAILKLLIKTVGLILHVLNYLSESIFDWLCTLYAFAEPIKDLSHFQ